MNSKERAKRALKKVERLQPIRTTAQKAIPASNGQWQVFILQEELAYDDESATAKMRLNNRGSWSTDSREIELVPWFETGKKLSEGREVLCLYLGGQWLAIAPKGCFEDA